MERTVVLVGRTGAGKSSCANAIAQEDRLFEESNDSYSATSTVDAKTRKVPCTLLSESDGTTQSSDKVTVKIVDTIGLGDTTLPSEEVLRRIAEACYECKDGINAVYFVTKSRFTEAEANAFDILSLLFGPEVINYITIVRTHFVQYENEQAVREDQEKLKIQSGPAGRITANVKRPPIYVSIPSPHYHAGPTNRKKSGSRLLNYLVTECKKTFRPPNLSRIYDAISEYFMSKEDLEKKSQVTRQLLQDAEESKRSQGSATSVSGGVAEKQKTPRPQPETLTIELEMQRDKRTGKIVEEMKVILRSCGKEQPSFENILRSLGVTVDGSTQVDTQVAHLRCVIL